MSSKKQVLLRDTTGAEKFLITSYKILTPIRISVAYLSVSYRITRQSHLLGALFYLFIPPAILESARCSGRVRGILISRDNVSPQLAPASHGQEPGACQLEVH